MQAERESRENVTPSLPEDTLWVRFAFVDHAGIPKAKAVHRDGFGRRAQAGVGLAKGVLALDPSGALHPESGLSPVGECRLVPDLSTLTALPFARGQAMVSCDMTEPDATTPWEGCPRSALKRVLGWLAERGYRAVASYEVEFYVWGPEGPLDRTPYAGSFALTTAADFMVELAETLNEMGLSPEQCHAEVGHGNLELSVGEDEALTAADERVTVLEAIRGVAHKMGLKTTMAPKPYLDAAGNGHHLHVSLYEGEDPVLFDSSGALSGPGRGLVGGILEHLPAVMAFTAPSPNSYQRFVPGMWSSAFAAYGLDNREAAVRLASPVAGRESATAKVEIKPVDVTSNPYLALAAVLAAGMDGINRGLDPGEPTMVDPATLSEDERAAKDIRPLPASPDEALDALEGDAVLVDAIGEPLVRTHVAVARAQAAMARELPPEEVAATAAELY
ncbi:MAG TPA: glutamine synthetase family protein [Thermoanaerobaculia bacterium]|nr:glutamine synthetase family protein [Thermoanaerobaculia bacterium]